MTDTLDDRAESNRQIIREAFDAWRAGTARITDGGRVKTCGSACWRGSSTTTP
jgi:hypothetical protein